MAGGTKARVLENCIRPGDHILEFGTYIGFSALLMARRLRMLGCQGSITSVEVDAGVAHVARCVVSGREQLRRSRS